MKFFIPLFFFLFSPLLVFAASPRTFSELVTYVTGFINKLTPVLVAMAFLVFFWGTAQFILKSSDDAAREDSKKMMVAGVIGLFVMVSIWGLVNFLIDTFLAI